MGTLQVGYFLASIKTSSGFSQCISIIYYFPKFFSLFSSLNWTQLVAWFSCQTNVPFHILSFPGSGICAAPALPVTVPLSMWDLGTQLGSEMWSKTIPIHNEDSNIYILIQTVLGFFPLLLKLKGMPSIKYVNLLTVGFYKGISQTMQGSSSASLVSVIKKVEVEISGHLFISTFRAHGSKDLCIFNQIIRTPIKIMWTSCILKVNHKSEESLESLLWKMLSMVSFLVYWLVSICKL